ncbi:CHAT domain-containing protein [Thiorhodococcus drewsii]|nr:CHAT domain-containing protein [Thiorhodococcus drewsii]
MELTSNLIYQKKGEYSRQQSRERKQILNDSASRGWSIPPGHVHGAFNDMQVKSVRNMKDIAWSSLEETLDAFKSPYYSELANDFFAFCESFFPASLCEPYDQLKSMGWTRPHEEMVNKKLRSELENARYAALHDLRTKIDLYATKLQSTLSTAPIANGVAQLPRKITVLFIASNPTDQPQLRLDEEIRSITKRIRESEYRDAVVLKSVWAARPTDLLQAINKHKPTIVHFSGHGSSNDELVLQDDTGETKLISLRSIAEMFKVVSSGIKLVVFNTCFSANQANEIVAHISSAIGMNTSVGDDAAQVFSAQLYSAISFGKSIRESFDQAKVALMLENIPEDQTPQLFMHIGIEDSELVLVRPQEV